MVQQDINAIQEYRVGVQPVGVLWLRRLTGNCVLNLKKLCVDGGKTLK